MDIKDWIRTRAHALGFEAVGFAPATLPEAVQEDFHRFIELGYHGEMDWLEERAHVRQSPEHMWPDVRSVIVLGMNYGPEHNPLHDLKHTEQGNISVYARNRDYHDIMKGKLKQLAGQLVSHAGGELKVFVDTAPVLEKPLANLSGIGWQGKHTCIVSRDYGSWLFLGIIYTTLALEAETVESDHCGSCTKCLDICPTDAFIGPRQMDARRCISYLTIEFGGIIPMEFRRPMGNRIYGCDDCLAICPWNKFAETASESGFHVRESLQNPSLEHLLTLDDAAFRQLFRKSPVKRIGRDRFIRNVLIAAGNSGHTNLIDAILPHIQDPAVLVRAIAVWALGELCSEGQIRRYRQQYGCEERADEVTKEWTQALARKQKEIPHG